MTELPETSISICPRCELVFEYGGPELPTLARQQMERCSYCAENGRRIGAGRRVLAEPTEAHPAGRLR
jgi:hypothetical protein